MDQSIFVSNKRKLTKSSIMKKLLSLSLILLILSSCNQSSDVVSSGLFQKRKYRTGFHLQKRSHIKEIATQSNPTWSDSIIAENQSGEPMAKTHDISQDLNAHSDKNEAPNESATSKIKLDKKLVITKSYKLIKPSLAAPLESLDVEYTEPREKEIKNKKNIGAIALLLSVVGFILGALPILSILSLVTLISLSFELVMWSIPIFIIASIVLGIISVFLAKKSHEHSKMAVMAKNLSTIYLLAYQLFWLMAVTLITLFIVALLISGGW